MDTMMIAFVVLFAAILISRMINQKANKHLDQDKKAALVDLFSKDNVYTLAILIGIMALFFFSLNLQLTDPTTAYIIYIIAIFGFIAASSYRAYQKLKANNFPESYIRSYILSTSLRFLGLLTFCALMKYQ